MTAKRAGALVLGSMISVLLIGGALIAAQVEPPGRAAPIPEAVEWRFSEPQPDWKSELPLPGVELAGFERTTDALRVTLSAGPLLANKTYAGGVYVDLPDWRREEWADVIVRARTTGS